MKGRSHRLQSHDLHEDWIDGSWTVDCVCGVNFDDGEEMVNCDECGVWVHTRCSRYVKGDELFTCDKCKNRNNKDDSEETEVAQLLVELPTKTIRLESTFPAPNGPTRRPLRLWTDIPMAERVHVQGIPGGDPALFTGLSSVFTQELWKCTGYVPKKFSFNYREFPCWDEKVGTDGRNEEDNENTVDKGAGVLFSLAKETVLATPAAALIGMRGSSAEGAFDRKQYTKEREISANGDDEVRHSQIALKKERSLLRPTIVSNNRKKDDQPKERSGKKKVRVAYKEVDVRKRVSHVSRTTFTSTSDAKTSEFYEERGLKSVKMDSHNSKSKNLGDSVIQENISDCHVSVGNGVEIAENRVPVVECLAESFSDGISGNVFSAGAQSNEVKASHEGSEVVENSCKLDNVAVSVPEHNVVGGMQVEQEGDTMPEHKLEENVEGSAGSNVRPPAEELGNTISETKLHQNDGDQNVFPRSMELNVKVDADDNCGGGLDGRSSACEAKDVVASHDNAAENLKMCNVALIGSPSANCKTSEFDRTSELDSDCRTDKHNSLTGEPSPIKQELGGSEGSIPLQKCFSEPKFGSVFAEELCKPAATTASSSAFHCQNKIVLCIGKPSSNSANAITSKSAASDNIRSVDPLDPNPNARQRVMSEFTSITKKDRAGSDVTKVKDEDSHEISRKIVKEHPKSSVSSASKAPQSSKISHTYVLKRTVSDSKDSTHHTSSKTSSARNSSDTAGMLQNECSSHVQNKALASGISVRGEKLNQSNIQLSSKAHPASSLNPPPSTNSSATLSDEELALRLHQELNSSPRVSRVPRRHAGSLPQLASPTASSMLIKCSSSGGRDHSSVPRRKHRDSSKDGFSRSLDPDNEAKPSLSGQMRQDTAHEMSRRDDNESPAALHSIKKNVPPSSASIANAGPSSSAEVNDHNLSSTHDSPRNISDEDTGTVRAPVHRTLPGLINEIMSKGRRMTYEELCNAVLPHWHNLRKHNGERYAYSSPSQAVLDCLRNRHEWAQLVDRGPKTSSSRKRRKPDAEESEDNGYGKGRSAKEGEGKSLESQRGDVPKRKRNARKRRRVVLQGRGIKEIRGRRKAEMLTDDDSGPSSNSSEESSFSEEEIQDGGRGTDEASASSDEAGTV